ncbi:GNAT family N-acetyltransferase [Streptomyces sp. NPDC059788]|uniref:GNAT family N-acetyltransferase n=1 Tax=Streptomyces sp. NPDC059788 TaxID=3346948 RepID=UPI00364B7EE8
MTTSPPPPPLLTPVSVATRLHVRTLEGPRAHTALAVLWPGLYRHDPDATPYQSPAWLTSMAAHMPPTDQLLMLVVTDDWTRPVAGLALVRRTDDQGLSRIRPLGSPWSEYVQAVGPQSARPAAAAALRRRLEALAHDGAHVVIPDVPVDSALGQQLAAAQWQQHDRALARCARLTLPVDYEALPRSARKDHARRARTWVDLMAQDRVHFTRTRTREQLRSAYLDLARLHRRRWASDAPLDLDLVLRCGADAAFVASLSLDGQLVAAQLCLARGRRVYSVLPAMNPEHADLAPGHSLLRRLLDELHYDGYESVDLGRTRDNPNQISYKQQYGPIWTSTLTAMSPGVG